MIQRRQLLKTLVAASLFPSIGMPRIRTVPARRDLRDWLAVRDLFPLAPDWTHLSSFLFVSHPTPVAAAIERFRKKLDADPFWVEIAWVSDAEGRPFAAVKRALADYTGGSPAELCLTVNTTTALAMAYQGLRIRPDQEIVTTEHDHYSHHESVRYAAARSGAPMRSTRRSRHMRTARSYRRRRQPSCRRAGLSRTSICSPFRRRWSCIARSVATGSRPALQN